MLNYNVNYIEPLRSTRNFLLGEINYTWARSISTAGGVQSGSIIFGTGSIDYVPYAPTTLFVSGTYQSEKIGSGSALGQPVNVTVTGSGVWPITGSNVLFITIGGNLGFSQATSSILSATLGNMNLSGSKISSSFTPLGNQTYNVDFGLTHTKGNIYNPIVKLKTENTSPSTTTGNVNGYTASFNMKKDEIIPLYSFAEITGSNSINFNYEYNFGITSSLSASINNVTGSTTMSIIIPQAGINNVQRWFNPNTTEAKISSSFVATTDSAYEFTASVEFNKGNVSNSDINWKVSSSSTTEDLEGNQTNINGVSSSFQLKKDIAVMVNYSEITSSINGTYKNNYSFNQTASITSHVNNTTGSVTMSLIIPEAGISTSSLFFNPNTTTAYISASFVPFGQAPFNITASIINNKGNVSNSDINWKVSGSNNNLSSSISASFSIVKNANESKVAVPNILIPTASTFTNEYAFNQTASLSASFTSYWLSCLSQSAAGVTVQLIVPEIGVDLTTYTSNEVLTASFASRVGTNYNITASANASTSSILPATIYVCGGLTNFNQGLGPITSASIGLIQNFAYDVIDWHGTNPSIGAKSSFRINSFTLANPVNSTPLIISASASSSGFGQTVQIPANTFTDYFPFPFQPSTQLIFEGSGTTVIGIAYFGEPSMQVSGYYTTVYDSGSNMTLHRLMSEDATATYFPIPTQSFDNHIEAETLVLGGGGRSGISADYWAKQIEFFEPAATAGGGGAGGYVYNKNYFNKAKSYTITVANSSSAWINDLPASPYEGIVPLSTSGSNSYIVDNTGTLIQLAKGGGHGAPQTYYNSLASSNNINRNGNNGGTGGGAGFWRSQNADGGASLSGSVTLPSSSYNAWEGFYGGGFLGGNFVFGGSGGGGGVSTFGQGANTGYGPTGNGGLGKYTLDFVPNKVGGGGCGYNNTQTSSFEYGGGLSGKTGSATDGLPNTGGGGGGVAYDASNQFYSTIGGSGLVQIRYKGLPQATGGVITTGSLCDGVYTLHTFTASGTFTPTP